MQSSEVRRKQSGLLLALRRYCSAVGDMERTVLLPSLLRDVASDQAWDRRDRRDLYGDYLMLKAIRNAAESCPAAHGGEEMKAGGSTALSKQLEPLLLSTDPQTRFLFHLRGLFSVVSELTDQTHSLTHKYMDIVGAPH